MHLAKLMLNYVPRFLPETLPGHLEEEAPEWYQLMIPPGLARGEMHPRYTVYNTVRKIDVISPITA